MENELISLCNQFNIFGEFDSIETINNGHINSTFLVRFNKDGKIDIIVEAYKRNIPIISAMGAGNKLDPTRFEVTDIYKTSVCPLAKVMRRELKNRGIKKLKVVYSKEEPIKIEDYFCCEEELDKKRVPGSLSYVPSCMGLIIASEIVKDIMKK